MGCRLSQKTKKRLYQLLRNNLLGTGLTSWINQSANQIHGSYKHLFLHSILREPQFRLTLSSAGCSLVPIACSHHRLSLEKHIENQSDPSGVSFVFLAEHKIPCSVRELTGRPCGAGSVGVDTSEYRA